MPLNDQSQTIACALAVGSEASAASLVVEALKLVSDGFKRHIAFGVLEGQIRIRISPTWGRAVL
jgi:hypothetical protein